ncbi:uncharacterized protein A4U43_C02F9570 [Asparagus officinalis]|uniref:DUF4110 domain-containing protein n=1 Tax=Asparagus officinalis TaxID=4686 RepID=A0A5P1FHB0_ASPOF|nr:uncharacterized protein A4U43_C02F9570 [Asparagus officinalis]
MGKKSKKPGHGKEKTERKTAKAEEKRGRRESKKVSEEDDIDAILRNIQKEEAKKKEVHVDDNVPRPSPRSNCSLTINPQKETELVLYGGEFYNGSKTFVYGDLYRYDVEKNEWKLVSSPNSPPPRSSHQAVAWKDHIYMFGGEFTSPNQERFHHYKWQEIKPRPGCLWPSARSGFQLFVYQDEVKKSGMPPGPRAGFSMCVHKKRAMLFGGVVDMEVEGDVLMSLFINELYGFQLDNRRWYPLELRKEKSTKGKLKASNKSESSKGSVVSNKSIQDDLEMSIANDDENMEDDEEATEMQCDMQEISHQMTKSLACNDVSSKEVSDVKVQGLGGSSSCLQGCTSVEIVKPCGRINACMVVGRDTLFVYGGMMEVRDREITLDDLYSLNLSKLDEWKCILAASESEWQEASEDEDDGDSEEESGDESGCNESDEDDEDMSEDEVEKTLDAESAVSILKGEKKNLRRKEKRARIDQIRVTLGLSDSQRTPMPGETLRDFYKRTSMYWQMAAHEHTQHTGKELRKDGFDLAEVRYKELKPILDELAILEAEQKAEEEEGPETSSRKRGPNKNKNKNSKR